MAFLILSLPVQSSEYITVTAPQQTAGHTMFPATCSGQRQLSAHPPISMQK